MGLYKKYYLLLTILYSSIFSIEHNIDCINNFSSIDFSTINNSEFQFNLGAQSNELVGNLYFFSLDKLVSENLFLSMKFSRYEDKNFEIYNQNSLSFSPKNNPINFLFSFNNLSINRDINSWASFGVLFDFKIKQKVVFLFGSYYDIAYIDDSHWTNVNYYIGSKLKLVKNTTSLISIQYNPDYSLMNQSIELSIGL